MVRIHELSLQKTPIDLQSLNLIDFHLLFSSALQLLFAMVAALNSMFRTSADLRVENLALRQQLTVLRRSAPKRFKLTPADRIFWLLLRRVWADWRSALMIVKAETVVALASERISLVLEVEDPSPQVGSAQRAARGSGSDSHDEPQQPALGCTTHSRRVAQAGY